MERRRLLDIPHSEDLVFYAPLDLEHGTTEILHNITPITESGATVSWNTTKQKYNLYAYNNASGKTTSALFYQNIGMGLANTNGVTVCIDMEEQSMSATYPAMISTPKYADGNCVLLRHANFNASPYTLLSGRFVVTCSVWNGSSRVTKYYHNGVLKNYVARLGNGLNNTWFTNNKYSTCHQIKMVTNSSTKFIASGPSPMTTSSSDTANAIGAYYNAGGRSSGFPRTLAKVAYVCNANEGRSYYQGGALYGSYPSYNPYLPSNWVQTSNGVAIALTGDANRYGTQYYGKEYYIFNTALDIATIRKIQGYE